MDSREVGRFGTIHYMKRLVPDSPVVAFPIDEESVTFGRDSSCNIRLYYPDISPIHCKVFIEDRKAFIAIHGTNGIVVDGCHVYPNSSSPSVVPLLNFSEFEIRSRKFRFCYPPKEIRAALLATPTGSDMPRRALRLSMIQSALVFSPRPSSDPQENLRVLQSPMRLFNGPGQSATAGDEIVLVQGSTPRVLEEEKDLVICENIVVDADAMDSSTPPGFRSIPASPSLRPNNVQTPRRPLTSLHRAVLIRSAKKAVLRAEMEQQDAEEEDEVEHFMTSDMDVMYEDDVENEDESDEDDGEEQPEAEADVGTSSGWRKSLGAVRSIVWPFKPPTSSPDFSDEGEAEEFKAEDDLEAREIDQEENDESEPEYDQELKTEEEQEDMDTEDQESLEPPEEPLRNIPTSFSTPQAKRRSSTGPVRFSIGGQGDLRKMNLEPTWRVKDIVLPEEHEQVKEEPVEHTPRPKITSEERDAIRERRRSALTTPDPFFGGHAPGTRPRESLGGRLSTPLRTPRRQTPHDSKMTPGKLPALGLTSHDQGTQGSEDIDTQLSQMRAQIEEAKRRKRDAMQRGTPDLQRSPRKRSAELRALLHIEEDAEEEQTTQETSALVDASSPAPHIRNEHQPAESSNAGLQTPVLKGVREMFQQRQVPDTPAFEGMAEMLEPPQLPSQEESMEERPADDLPSPTPLPKRRTVNKSRLPKAVQSETPSLADDEASPLPTTVDPAESAPAKTPALRLLRSRRTPASEVKETAASKARKVPQTRKGAASAATTTPSAPTAGEMSTDNSEGPKPVAKRTRKTVVPKKEEDVAPVAGPPRRKGKQVATVESSDPSGSNQSEQSESTAKSATKPTVRSTRAAVKNRVKDEPAEDSLPSSDDGAAALGTRSRAKGAAAAKPRTTRTSVKKNAAGTEAPATDPPPRTNKENAQDDGAAASKPPRTTRRTPATVAAEKQASSTIRVTRARTKTT